MPTPPYLTSNTSVSPDFRALPSYGGVANPVIPVAGICSWMVGHSDPATASNAGSLVQRVDSLTGSAHRMIPCAGATSALVCLQYDPSSSKTTTGPPVIQLIGIDKNGVPQTLSDADGATTWTLAVASGSDLASSASAYYTAPVEVDLQNCEWLLVCIKTAATGTAFGTAVSDVLVKLK